MKGKFERIFAGVLGLLGFAMLTASTYAQSTFVYTNNETTTANTVSAFVVGVGGTLTMVPGSPFLTGGVGGAAGLYASHRITTVTTSTGSFLYASNSGDLFVAPGSNDISAFSINTANGVLTSVGLPVSTGAPGAVGDISLAATPNGQFLYAGKAGLPSATIWGFSIGSNGALSPLPGFPISGGGDGMTVSPDGKFLALAVGSGVEMFSIAATGALTPVAGSPFPGPGNSTITDVAINCASNLLFAADSHPIVTVYTIASNGALAQIAGSPFTIGGSDSNVGVLSPDDRFLFVSNQSGNTITSLNVGAGGGLTQVTGSPFPNSTGNTPVEMATNQAGTLLYVANISAPSNVVTGFSIASGVLSPVPGSPFATGISSFVGGLESLTVFPAKACGCKKEDDEDEGEEQGDDGREGHLRFTDKRECKTKDQEFEEPDAGERLVGLFGRRRSCGCRDLRRNEKK
jgi:6-phosphogluconolactonase